MRITLLGTGDAIGTPKIGCSCLQCTYAKETGSMRLRTSLLIEEGNFHLLVDSSPDLRQQLLMHGSPHIDAVVWTHGHYDHFMGFGEFYRVQRPPLVLAPAPVMDYCAGIFRFLSFDRQVIEPYEPCSIGGITLTPVMVSHPPVFTCGLIIETGKSRVGFTSDTNIGIPARTLSFFEDLDLLLLDALAPKGVTISKHMNYPDALTLAERLRPKEFRCVHISHLIPWDLPFLARDGDIFEFA